VLFYEEDPEVPEEEPYQLDESDRPVFEAQLPFIESTGIRYWNCLTFRGPSSLQARVRADAPLEAPMRCLAPWKVFYVRADGGVRTCCTLRSSMGDLGRQSFEDVWNGEAYTRLRRAFAEQADFPAACLTCTDPLRTWGER
jgi:MoaA/NifB/PqqE/SkfB family radical SAM enzyme